MWNKAVLNACKMTVNRSFHLLKDIDPALLIKLCTILTLPYFRKAVIYQWQYFIFLAFYIEVEMFEGVQF